MWPNFLSSHLSKMRWIRKCSSVLCLILSKIVFILLKVLFTLRCRQWKTNSSDLKESKEYFTLGQELSDHGLGTWSYYNSGSMFQRGNRWMEFLQYRSKESYKWRYLKSTLVETNRAVIAGREISTIDLRCYLIASLVLPLVDLRVFVKML